MENNTLSNALISNSTSSGNGYIFVIIFLLLLIGFCIFMIVKTSSMQSKAKTNIQKNLNFKNASMFIVANHLIGLNLPANTLCSIFSCKEKYEFIANGTIFSLKKFKVTDVSLKTDTEIQKQIVSSVGGAIGGAVLLGPLGAMLGGRAKTKEIRTTTTCLIFTYKNEDKLDFAAFNVTNNIIQASKFVKEFQAIAKSRTNEVTNIEL